MRYIPHTDEDIRVMLERIGARDLDEIFEQIPEDLRLARDLDLPAPMSEPEVMAHVERLAGAAPAGGLVSFLGGGAYRHHVPPAVDQILLRSEVYTAYTPYQPEVSQGTLQAIFEFQSLVCRLLGMGAANASMYDGASATAEAVLMARRVTRRSKVVVSEGLHPEYRAVIGTYLSGSDSGDGDVVTVAVDPETGATDLAALAAAVDGAACAVIGLPSFWGVVERFDEAARIAAGAGALAISVTTEPFAFGVLAPPGELGADIAVAEGQPLGIPVSFGGPGLGLFAVRDDKKLVRQMPGRLVGQTADASGRTGYVLTLATREQHIRREKATSNICTNQGLCAVAVAVSLGLLGRDGFSAVARSCLARSEYLKRAVAATEGLSLRFTGPTFNEFAVRCEGRKASDVLAALEAEGFLGGLDLGRFDPSMDDTFLVAVTECAGREVLDSFIAALGRV